MLSGGDSKKDGRAEPKAKERSEAELRNPRQRMEEGCGFLQPKRMHAKSQTLPDLPRRLGALRQRALRRGSRIMPKENTSSSSLHITRLPASQVSSSLAHGLSLRLAPYAVASGKHKNPEKNQTGVKET